MVIVFTTDCIVLYNISTNKSNSILAVLFKYIYIVYNHYIISVFIEIDCYNDIRIKMNEVIIMIAITKNKCLKWYNIFW